MGIDACRSRFQPKPSSAMITSPGLRRIEQSLSYPAGAAVRCHGKVLNPGALPKTDRHEIQIDGRESHDCVARLLGAARATDARSAGIIRDEDGGPIISHGRFQTISGNGG
jgi:hypothetical protein